MSARLFRKAGNPPDHDGVLDVLAVAGPDSIPMENPDPSVLLTLLLAFLRFCLVNQPLCDISAFRPGSAGD